VKILFVSDEESKSLWDYFEPDKVKGIDLIISCGDLKPEYLSFLVTMCPVPLYYVHGNHDGKYERKPPEGCECIEDTIVEYKGLRIMGLGGSANYSDGVHQYTEKEMQKRIRKMRRKLRKSKGIDILVTHAPLHGYGDDPDRAHRGFDAFFEVLDKHKPKYMAHGHVHMNYMANRPRIIRYNETTIINACERYVLDTEKDV